MVANICRGRRHSHHGGDVDLENANARPHSLSPRILVFGQTVSGFVQVQVDSRVAHGADVFMGHSRGGGSLQVECTA